MIYALSVPGPIEDVDQVRVLEWHGEVGQRFETDQLVVELETHKAIVEVRAAQQGYLRSVLSEAGDWCAIGKPLALVSDTPDEPLPDSPDDAGDLLVAFEIT